MSDRDYFVRHENGSFSGVLTIKAIKKEIFFMRQPTPTLALDPSHFAISENSKIGFLWPRRRRTGTESYYVMIDDPSLVRPMMGVLRRSRDGSRYVIDKARGFGISKRVATQK